MTRLETYAFLAGHLAGLDDGGLTDLLAPAHRLGSGIGGQSLLVTVDGHPIFVKLVPLTDLETQPGHLLSTANLFDLPLFCQYRLGSPGFGVWRELAAHRMTTEWVIAGDCPHFPLLYQWRIMREGGLPPADVVQAADLEEQVRFWGGSDAVRRRLTALRAASAQVALFLEYVPHTLQQWLQAQVAAGGRSAEADVRFIDNELRTTSAFMADQGFTHFDAHFENILTDGQQLYFSDFGLSLSSRFALTVAERAFLARHRCYDQANAALSLVICLLGALCGPGDWEEQLRGDCRLQWAEGSLPVMAEVIRRDAPVALALKAFFRQVTHDKQSIFPAEQIERLLAGTG